MNLLKINIYRSLLAVLFASLFFMMACEEEELLPDAYALFRTSELLAEEERLEAPVDMLFVNKSKDGLSYLWDFGNAYLKGEPGTNTFEGVSPDTVYFPVPGVYEVKVTATGGKKGDETYTQTFEVFKETPKISYELPYEGESILVDSTVQFNVSFFQVEGATPTFEWTFPDGEPATSSSRNPQVSFSSAGVKEISLTLNDGEEVLQVSKQVEVKEDIAPTLYFTDMASQRIYKKQVFQTPELDEEAAVEGIGITLPDDSRPMTMFVDNKRVFVTHTNGHQGPWGNPRASYGEIFSFNLDGSDKRVIVTGGSGHNVPFSVTTVGSDMYFLDRLNGILKTNKTLENQMFEDVPFWVRNADSEYYGNGFGWGAQNGTVAYHDGKIWWSKNSNHPGLYTIAPDLPKNSDGLVTGEKLLEDYYIRSFNIDEENGKIYFFHNKEGGNDVGMYMADIDGSNVSLIEAYTPGVDLDGDGHSAQLLGITGIAVHGDYVYWGYRDNENAVATSGVKRAKLDGTEVEMYLSGYVPYGIAFDPVAR
jgi:hypothetical protein